VIALPLAASMGIVLTLAQFDWSQALHDRGVWLAVLAQFGAAISVLLRDYDAWLMEPGVDWRIRRRFGLVLLRWVIVLLAAWSVLAAFPFYAVALVAVCTLATIARALSQSRAARIQRGGPCHAARARWRAGRTKPPLKRAQPPDARAGTVLT
jgi:hypothetical protein